MDIKVSGLAIACMVATAAISFLIPLALLWYVRKKKGADLAPFFVGCIVFVLFALVLEGALNRALLLNSAAGERILGSPWLYGIVGGLMAGIFDETGRFVAFKTALRKYRGKDSNAFSYGIGHGGIEAMLLIGLSYISNIALSLMINSGMMETLLAQVPAEAAAQVQGAFAQLTGTAPSLFLMAGLERISAIGLHIALSVLVWFAAKKRGLFALYPLAVLLHALVDMVTAIAARLGMPALAVEGLILLSSAACVAIAVVIWRKQAEPPAGTFAETTVRSFE